MLACYLQALWSIEGYEDSEDVWLRVINEYCLRPGLVCPLPLAQLVVIISSFIGVFGWRFGRGGRAG